MHLVLLFWFSPLNIYLGQGKGPSAAAENESNLCL